MAEAQAAPGRIFVSYRREDSAYPAGWLCERLTEHFGQGQVFKDVDSIELGEDFVEAISRAVASCDVLLAVIGADWLDVTDAEGRRRLDDPEDFVRVEIEAGLRRDVRVIPILVDGARMPRAAELPPSLSPLVRRHALELSPNRFDYDTSRLLSVLDETLVEIKTGMVPTIETIDPEGGAADSESRGAGTAAATSPLARGESRLRWIFTGVVVGVVLLLLLLAPAVLPAVLANRKNQPPSDAWMFLLWMLPAAPLLASAWILARKSTRFYGGALACVAVATIWVASSWALIEGRELSDSPRLEHLVLIVPLLVAAVGLFLTIGGARDAVRLNPWGPAGLALVLVLLGTTMRIKSLGLGKLVAGTGGPSWLPDADTAFFWVHDFIPLVVAVLAAVLTVNAVQSQALRTFVYLHLAYYLVIEAGSAVQRSTGDVDAARLYQELVFLLGVLCVVVAVQIGQSGRRRRGAEAPVGSHAGSRGPD
jgi:hypothetical protein